MTGWKVSCKCSSEIRWARMNISASTCCHECNAGFRRTGSRNGQIIAIAVSPPSRSAFRLSTSPSYVRSARTAGTGREEMCRMMQDIKERNARQMWESGSFSSVRLRATSGHMGYRGWGCVRVFSNTFLHTDLSLSFSLNGCRLAGHCEGDPRRCMTLSKKTTLFLAKA